MITCTSKSYFTLILSILEKFFIHPSSSTQQNHFPFPGGVIRAVFTLLYKLYNIQPTPHKFV